ncbi:unnamed protein product [Coccothraustes coccothraustes]
MAESFGRFTHALLRALPPRRRPPDLGRGSRRRRGGSGGCWRGPAAAPGAAAAGAAPGPAGAAGGAPGGGAGAAGGHGAADPRPRPPPAPARGAPGGAGAAPAPRARRQPTRARRWTGGRAVHRPGILRGNFPLDQPARGRGRGRRLPGLRGVHGAGGGRGAPQGLLQHGRPPDPGPRQQRGRAQGCQGHGAALGPRLLAAAAAGRRRGELRLRAPGGRGGRRAAAPRRRRVPAQPEGGRGHGVGGATGAGPRAFQKVPGVQLVPLDLSEVAKVGGALSSCCVLLWARPVGAGPAMTPPLF